MVYVLNQNGQPLMPTENHAKVRILLKQGKANVVNKCPFTIQLLYSQSDYTQKVTLGVDAGADISAFRQLQKTRCFSSQTQSLETIL